MQKVVAPPQRQIAALLLLRAKTRVVELPAVSIGKQKAGKKLLHTVGISSHDGAESLARRGALGIEAADGVGIGLIGDVLVECAARLLSRKQKRKILGGKNQRRLREEENIAGFEPHAPLARLPGAEGASRVMGMEGLERLR